MTAHDSSPGTTRNGRRAAFAVLLVAFLASATTAVLAFVFSHRAVQADAAALRADTEDLRSMVAAGERDAASGNASKPGEATGNVAALAAWKPRTPCGAEARDALHLAIEARTSLPLDGRLMGADERATLEAALHRCATRPPAGSEATGPRPEGT